MYVLYNKSIRDLLVWTIIMTTKSKPIACESTTVDAIHTTEKSLKNKKFCKYCWDRGLSKELCFSHYVKDNKGPSGVIVCPNLLAEQCMRCGEYGHTPRYCASLTPLLTLYNPTGDAAQCNMEMFRMIYKETWIEPIPAHLREQYDSWVERNGSLPHTHNP